ncbi:allantoate amidohydrolase [Niallia circulans]|uniref:Zn-dependent hydrolase n=1 Tax=Shouchella clausii TaxID=79880 RepID=UPI000B978A57|nr:Zn-dependent hydrolase [Shouchella clausii]SPT78251.1 allantoate amidohydrolase [Niallia circulans]AST95997.1 allantoate amidohydrolase [Shouchella clausii]MCR1288203.1 Zn-dependent hydrolase [Shouchella clausii]MEB5474430.1 Zn-dependent hydrolase [Shouchella clausii]PTL21210.1 Zn-dependent hydrolase [Shouchella clausii]
MINSLETEQASAYIHYLARFGKTSDGGNTRLLYTPTWLEAQQAVFSLFQAKGLNAFFDDVGNAYGRIEGTLASQASIVTGSHIDTVSSGGKFDGAYGIIGSLLAVSRLVSRYGRPKKTIDVVSLCEEEGSRFPLAFWGSGSITGRYEQADIDALLDASGISLGEAMRANGFGQGHYQAPRRTDIDCFIELHIEQGQVLEHSGNKIGIAKAIVGQRRFTVTVEGAANHAGTTPMHMRKDAMELASRLITRLVNKARKIDEAFVATVGQIEAFPNTANVIPGKVSFSLDIRHHSTNMLDRYCEEMETFFHEQEQTSQLGISVDQWADVAPVAMDADLTALAFQSAQKTGLPVQYMYSGAGHDTQIFGSCCPTALLFVPSKGGISHSPLEFTADEDLEAGVSALAALLYKLAY